MATAAEPPAKRSRRANFSDEEIMMMITGWHDRQAVLREKFSNIVTAERKKQAWEEVTHEINSVSRVRRNREEVKKKFADFKSVVKKKLSIRRQEQEKTGGGTSEAKALTPLEEAMAQVLKMVQVSGVPGLQDPGSMYSI
ncbi:hypothetical protein Pmani_003629 [Petrolisthes manimaculis]|uniref:Regulatory protein zeste n=1 Tax=Petrolisthes manimaculis TaxID=1843537 RepID=A0AAE1QG53_9EUCA|nr:hypothetical protein Pmani_003629 [Petrolisthes manimaculis]